MLMLLLCYFHFNFSLQYSRFFLLFLTHFNKLWKERVYVYVCVCVCVCEREREREREQGKQTKFENNQKTEINSNE